MKMVAARGIAPRSPRLQRGANLSQLRSRGPSARTARAIALLNGRGAQDAGRRSDNPPRSIGYRPIALLLSYGGIGKWSPDEVTLLGLPDVSRSFSF